MREKSTKKEIKSLTPNPSPREKSLTPNPSPLGEGMGVRPVVGCDALFSFAFSPTILPIFRRRNAECFLESVVETRRMLETTTL